MTKLDKLKERLKVLELRSNRNQRDRTKLYGRITKESLQEAFKQGAFKEAKWRIPTENRWTMGTTFTLTGHDKWFKKLAKLLQVDHHCSVEISKEVTVYFSDWDIYLNFSTVAAIKAFVKQQGVKFDLGPIEKELNLTLAKVKELQEYLDMLKKHFNQ